MPVSTAGSYVSTSTTTGDSVAVAAVYVMTAMEVPLSPQPTFVRASGGDVSTAMTFPDNVEVAAAYISTAMEPPYSTGAWSVAGAYVLTAVEFPLDPPRPPPPLADIEELLPAMAARGLALEYFLELVEPFYARIWQDVGWLAESMVDLSVACEGWLDFRGDLVLESRRGLTDAEYRRIIAGRQSAQGGAHSLPGVWAGWLGLSGVDAADARILRLPPASVLLWADVTYEPSFLFVRRAGDVARDFVPSGYEVDAYLAQPGSAFWGTGVWGVDEWCYTLPTR